MPRPERALDPDGGPLHRFAIALRELRRDAGTPTYRDMAAASGYSVTALSDAAGGRRLPSLPVTLAYVRACGGDTEVWLARWRDVGTHEAQQGADGGIRPPYQGLAPFEVADADWFFGRDHLISILLDRLAGTRFLAVVGPSGSGKSSLLRAGLLPARAPGTVCLLSPGDRPADLLSTVQPGHDLVVVDQFEEAFTLCRDANERQRFFDGLAALAMGPDAMTVVIAVRADFLGACLLVPALATLMSEATLMVGPMTERELEQAVTGPAALAGLTVERALLGEVLSNSRGEAGALPLLSHALQETWRLRRSTTLTLAGYTAAGGIAGAITNTAEQIYRSLPAAHQHTARELLLRLTALGEGTEDTRRRARRHELDLPGATQVIEQLAAARLLVLHDETVEIAHEALIAAWPRLRGWLAEDREQQMLRRQLTEAAAAWLALNRDPGALYRGSLLAVTRGWVSTPPDRGLLTSIEHEFLTAAIGFDDAERRAAERRNKKLSILSAALAVALVLVVVTAGIAIGQRENADERSREATSESLARQALDVAPTDVAQAMRLSLAAYRTAPTEQACTAVLSIAGRPTYAARLPHAQEVKAVVFVPGRPLLASAGQDGRVLLWNITTRTTVAALGGGHGAVRTIAAAGHYVAAGTLDGSVELWDVDTHAMTLFASGSRISAVALSPDATTLAALGAAPGVRRWHVPDARPLPQLPARGGQRTGLAYGSDGRLAVVDGENTVTVWRADGSHAATFRVPLPATTVAISPDGRHLAAGGDDPEISIVDTADASISTLRGHTEYVRGLAYDSTGQRLLSGGNDDFAILWDVRAARILTRLTGHTSELYTVAFSQDGDDMASAGRDSSVIVYDATSNPLIGHTDNITGLAVSPHGDRLVSTSKDHTARVWDIRNRRELGTLAGHAARVTAAAFSPTMPIIATSSDDRTVRLWNATTMAPLQVLRGHTDLVLSLAFQPNTGVLASAAADRTIRFWNPDGTVAAPALTFSGDVLDIAYTADGSQLIASLKDNAVAVIDTATRQRRMIRLAAEPTALAVSPDRSHIAVGDTTGTTTIWNIATERGETLPHRHTGTVLALAYSPDGALLAEGSMDRTITLWHTSDSTAYATLTANGADVLTVAWSPDGAHVYSAGRDRVITTWTTSLPQAIDTAAAYAP